MTKQLLGRTDNAIKNRYNSNLRKRLNSPVFAKLLNEKPRCRVVDFEDSVTLDCDMSESKSSTATKYISPAKKSSCENAEGDSSNERSIQS